MRKLSMLLITIIIMILILSVVPVSASSPPLEVMFEVPTVIPPGGGPFGTFTATGPAVDEGLVCPSGDTIAEFEKVNGEQSNKGFNVQVTYVFTCDDGSGQFYVKLQVRIDQKGDNFNWTILGGNGDYEKLHGTGKGIGIPVSEEEVFDIYEGKVHKD